MVVDVLNVLMDGPLLCSDVMEVDNLLASGRRFLVDVESFSVVGSLLSSVMELKIVGQTQK